jgi:hypothetical protein
VFHIFRLLHRYIRVWYLIQVARSQLHENIRDRARLDGFRPASLADLPIEQKMIIFPALVDSLCHELDEYNDFPGGVYATAVR